MSSDNEQIGHLKVSRLDKGLILGKYLKNVNQSLRPCLEKKLRGTAGLLAV